MCVCVCGQDWLQFIQDPPADLQYTSLPRLINFHVAVPCGYEETRSTWSQPDAVKDTTGGGGVWRKITAAVQLVFAGANYYEFDTLELLHSLVKTQVKYANS